LWFWERFGVANINRQIAEELGVREQQIAATVELLDGGATVPFVARYRKEVTGGLDDTQLRDLEERLTYLRELEGAGLRSSTRFASRASSTPRWGFAMADRQQGRGSIVAVLSQAPHQAGAKSRAHCRAVADATAGRPAGRGCTFDAGRWRTLPRRSKARAILVERFAGADLSARKMWSTG
jgi:hypothetical protein